MSALVINRVLLDIPSFWRNGDIDKVAKEMNRRKVVMCEFAPVFEPGKPGFVERFRTVDLNNVSHAITNFKSDDGRLTATVEILDTPAGKQVKEMMQKDVSFTFKPRRNNEVFVKGDCYDERAPGLFTFDMHQRIA